MQLVGSRSLPADKEAATPGSQPTPQRSSSGSEMTSLHATLATEDSWSSEHDAQAADASDALWEYNDPHNDIQGLFPATSMVKWAAKYMSDLTMVSQSQARADPLAPR